MNGKRTNVGVLFLFHCTSCLMIETSEKIDAFYELLICHVLCFHGPLTASLFSLLFIYLFVYCLIEVWVCGAVHRCACSSLSHKEKMIGMI